SYNNVRPISVFLPSNAGEGPGPGAGTSYSPLFHRPNGGAAIPGVLDHQRRADHFIQGDKTHDSTASYTAKFNTTYNVTQGSATPPTAKNVTATLVQVETTEKIAACELSQHQKRQKQEKNQRLQGNRETLHERLDRIEEKLIGTDNKKTTRSIGQANEAIHLVFEELSESVAVLDQVAKATKIETYESVIDEKKFLCKLIGKKPVHKESKGKEPTYQRGRTTQADGDTVITDAATGKPVDNPEKEDPEEDL
ncbi:hypothetical protein HDU76_011788, partial [Blyttiomyces sp. JEL0837]